ncbi:MAG TPA: DUF5777 family beta-barrel protein [Bacteroidales bacterium]|nr:DUF5777 family beta-barrel protein [Bacteroidales bacterium]
MKKVLLALILSAFLAPVYCQDDSTSVKSSEPVTMFSTSVLIDNPTVSTISKGSIQLQIQHRFSEINTIKDLYGIYGSANTRIGLNYGITDKFMIGVGTTKDYKLQDINWKIAIIDQTENNSVPVSVSYYGNIVLDARSDDAFGDVDRYKFIHRFSYFNEVIIARKINNMFSVQVAPSVTYFNAVPQYASDSTYKNVSLGLSFGGRANLFGNHSLIVEYDQCITDQPKMNTKPNLAIGWEIGTPTHTFQVFASNYSQIISQRNMVFNTNDLSKGQFLFGFNITVRF